MSDGQLVAHSDKLFIHLQKYHYILCATVQNTLWHIGRIQCVYDSLNTANVQALKSPSEQLQDSRRGDGSTS